MKDDALSPNHYARYKIQPIDFIRQNGLSFLQGNIIKYIVRYDAKNGVEDLKKARVYLDWLIEDAEGKAPSIDAEKSHAFEAEDIVQVSNNQQHWFDAVFYNYNHGKEYPWSCRRLDSTSFETFKYCRKKEVDLGQGNAE